jgi:hypothetical protein
MKKFTLLKTTPAIMGSLSVSGVGCSKAELRDQVQMQQAAVLITDEQLSEK